jgi:hypothetical protein
MLPGRAASQLPPRSACTPRCGASWSCTHVGKLLRSRAPVALKRQDALDAVIQLAAVVDEAVQAGAIPVDRGMHAAAMLMVLREFVQPLPPDWDGDGCTDYLNDDLAMMVTALREARQATGHKG